MKSFEKTKIGSLELKNRIAMAPMCMYSAQDDGKVTEFHKVHYGSVAFGQVGLIIVESTGVNYEGRISNYDLGLWDDNQIESHTQLTNLVKGLGAAIGVQLNHAGRKAVVEGKDAYAPSPIAFSKDDKTPKELTVEEIKGIEEDFRKATVRAIKAGYQLIEIHGAHGYLINQFLSPLTNKREDNYGGSLENRCRFLNEIKEIVLKEAGDIPVTLRISASDYKEGGIDIEEMTRIINTVKDGFKIIHVSSGGVVEDAKINAYPGYQVEFANRINKECKVDTMAVGLITTMEQVEEIIANGRAQMVSLGRVLLRDPNFVINNSRGKIEIPRQIKRAY